MKNVAHALLAAGLCFAVAQAQASTLSFGYDLEFSGAQAPAGSGPWLTALFDDHNLPGPVTLTIAAGGMSGTEKISDIFFNLDPLLAPANLVLTHISGVVASSISKGLDCCKADGDGKYDFQLSFATSGSNKFSAGQTVSYDIAGIGGLTASAFNFLGTPAGGNGPFLTAAHVLDTTGAGSGGSGWVAATATTATPLPAAAWLLATGLLGLAGMARRKRS